jgi:hypothetical protein
MADYSSPACNAQINSLHNPIRKAWSWVYANTFGRL